VACGDEISIGGVDLQVIDPLETTQSSDQPYWSLIADSSWLSGQEFPIESPQGKPLTLGRGSQCDVVVAGTHLSRQHAEIIVGEKHLTIRDLSSANGTFVNGKRITEAKIKPGDQVKLDVYSFRVFGPGIDLPSSSTTARYSAISENESEKSTTEGRKNWKIRPTSPGNREEIEPRGSKIFTLISASVILSLFVFALYLVLG